MSITSNLFPPIVETYAPAFLVGSSDSSKNICKVYFSISAYNSLEDVMNAQVTVTTQNTNLSVLNRTNYPCEVMLTTIKTDLTRTSDDKYYIEIKPEDIENGFVINQYYKVQIRFTAAACHDDVDLTPPQKIDSWLSQNLSNFSEWSTVCLIRGISVPSISINGFENISDTTYWSMNNVDLVGKLTFADESETDILESYRIKLYNVNNDLILDSGILYSNTYAGINEFNYTFEYIFNEGETYSFTFEYTTENMYADKITYNFIVIQENTEILDAVMTATLDDIDGAIVLNIRGQSIFLGNITIRRSSSESNFTIWEDVHTETFSEGKVLDYTWHDYTIKSGIYYKYIAQKRSSAGNRGIAIHALGEPFMVLFDDMYLTGDNGQQLCIRFDPSISSFKTVVSESKTDTIGNKYPYIKRNGAIEYRQFPIGGTITHLMDPSHLITSKEEIFKDSLEYYEAYNKDIYVRIDDFNDWTYEREFREKVKEFLHANKVRLFRSATEGNILVKLTDINFTPNATLGRRIYSFTATATEVDECNIKNYDKYGISLLGTYSTVALQFSTEYLGQLNENIPANTEALTLLKNKYDKYTKEGYVAAIQNLDYLKLEFKSKPYLIKEGVNGPYAVNDKGNNKEDPTSAILGYLVYINNKPIIINPEGIYECKGDKVEITSLIFPVDTEAVLDYHVNIVQTENDNTMIQSTSFFRKVGQKWGTFKPNDSIYQKIWSKYFEQYSNYNQVMLSLDGIKIEAEPGTVVYIKESLDSDFERHVIGDTYTLTLDAEDVAIEGLYFAGMHFDPATAAEQGRESIPSNKYIETGIILDKSALKKSNTFIKNGVYTLADDYLEILTETVTEPTLIDFDFLQQVGYSIWNGELYLKGEVNNQQLILEYEDKDDLVFVGERVYSDKHYFVKSKRQWSNQDTVSVIENSMEKEDTTYTISLERAYYDYYDSILNKEIDSKYALILQKWIDEANSRFIWYNEKWWLFTNNDDLLCPVDALIDYHCEIMKGRFAE